MKQTYEPAVEKGREKGSGTGWEPRSGVFSLWHPNHSQLRVVASDGSDWRERGLALPAWESATVSVRNEKRAPTAEELIWVSNLFWEPHETVMLFSHTVPAGNTLTLWRPIGVILPTPPVGA